MQMSSCESFDAEKLSSLKPWIGRYTVDTLHGFRHIKFWLPCRFFQLNTVSLTLLSFAMKIPFGLNSHVPGEIGQLAMLSGNTFMSTAMVNFMPSVGVMGERYILANMAALGILVFNLAVIVCVELGTGVFYSAKVENILVFVLMVFLFVIISFSGLAVPEIKGYLELQSFQMKRMMAKAESDDVDMFQLSKLEEYLVTGETETPSL